MDSLYSGRYQGCCQQNVGTRGQSARNKQAIHVESGETAIQQSLRFSVVISCFERRGRTCTTMKKHGSKPGQADLMRYPHICGTVDAVQRQPTLIPLSTGIGCPDFLRPFEDRTGFE